MPIISFFDGIKVLLFSNDHLPPYFHVYFAEYKATIEIESLDIIRGNLPLKQYNKVVDWAKMNRVSLFETFYQLNQSLRK